MPDGCLRFVLYISAQVLADLLKDSDGCTKPAFRTSAIADARLASMLWRCHHAIAKRHGATECESLALTAVDYAARRYVGRGHELSTRVSTGILRAREYIEASFAQELPLRKLADVAELSAYHFARSFERQIGLPPHAYLDSVRIRKALALLDRGERVCDVALAVGYADQSHFTRRFKRHLDVTPGQYVRTNACEANPLEEAL